MSQKQQSNAKSNFNGSWPHHPKPLSSTFGPHLSSVVVGWHLLPIHRDSRQPDLALGTRNIRRRGILLLGKDKESGEMAIHSWYYRPFLFSADFLQPSKMWDGLAASLKCLFWIVIMWCNIAIRRIIITVVSQAEWTTDTRKWVSVLRSSHVRVMFAPALQHLLVRLLLLLHAMMYPWIYKRK